MIIASIVQTLAVVVLVAVTIWYAITTARIARASEKSTKASQQMIREVQQDRAYRVRPIIVPLPGYRHTKTSTGGHDMTVNVVNIGTGPALNLEAESQLETIRMKGVLAGVAPGNSQELKLSGNEIMKTKESVLKLVYKSTQGQSFETVSRLAGSQFYVEKFKFGDIEGVGTVSFDVW